MSFHEALMARRIAKSYVEMLPPTQADALCGAYVMGSLASLADEEEFDSDASDIDIAVVIDTQLMPIDHERFPHGKFLIQEGASFKKYPSIVTSWTTKESFLAPSDSDATCETGTSFQILAAP